MLIGGLGSTEVQSLCARVDPETLKVVDKMKRLDVDGVWCLSSRKACAVDKERGGGLGTVRQCSKVLEELTRNV